MIARLVTTIGLVALTAAASYAQTVPAAPVERLLVIPFENEKRDARAYWLREAAAIILTDDLGALGLPVITRDDRVRAFDRLRVPLVASLSHATVIKLGQAVGATAVVVGNVELAGDELVVRVRPIRLDTGRMTAEIVERGPLGELFDIYARAARRLAPSATLSVEEIQKRHPPRAAFEQYVKGLIAESAGSKVSFLKQAIELAPTMHEARLALWDVHAERDEHQAALAAVLGVPTDHPLFRPARFRGAVSLLEIGMFAEAHARLVELNRVDEDSSLLNNLGIVQLRRPAGSIGGSAVDFFRQATRADPNDPDLFFNLGYAHWLQREPVSAITALREAVRRNPADDEAHYVLGVALQTAGSTAEAAREKELAKRLSSVFEEWEAKQTAAGVIPRGLERLKLEVDVPASMRLESAIVAAGQRDQQQLAAFHLDAGRRLYQAENYDEALAELRRVVYLSPYESSAHLLIGRIHLRGGRAQEAVDALKISIWSEDTVAGHLALAEAYLAAREPASARREIEIVLKREPGNADAQRLLSRIPPA